MLLRQLFNHRTFSYTYFLADPLSQEAVLIDPVKEKLRDYVQLFNELGYSIRAAIDTHTHDDHNSALPVLADLWGTESIRGASLNNAAEGRYVEHGEIINIGVLQLRALHTPGHTSDSYCFHLLKGKRSTVFTGDTLLVRTVGLSDQADSDPRQHYHSLTETLCHLPRNTVVYPGKDFKGWPLSTIGEELNFNPYLSAHDVEDFVAMKLRQRRADIRPLVTDEEVETDPSAVVGETVVPASESMTKAKPAPTEASYTERPLIEVTSSKKFAAAAAALETAAVETAAVETAPVDTVATETTPTTDEPSVDSNSPPGQFSRQSVSAVEKLARLSEKPKSADSNPGDETPPLPIWR
ncbi:MBL fold metallo-hydrolase [Halieaceae bacterium IMCC14734]|uniref:MBL fold metallo-hydrolase n=1 Tax=Candidatus Litorirhabdus singularis TaxID=2518993 RepID=A0ABT3TKK7_9GAMM|nr:MBL fold metallo-hydrolase [Candidatus Litorirhabdus singularis]MCX2982791.1 MBL fold metallo-hydrolase [Candidatus Litorirhabdus singularis]